MIRVAVLIVAILLFLLKGLGVQLGKIDLGWLGLAFVAFAMIL